MKIVKPDGIIEIGCSGCCCPPGEKRGGQHTNSTTTWWRVNDEPWNYIRSMQHYVVLAEAAENVAEFREAAEKSY